MVPIFGGRLWSTVATWSLMIPAIGIGYAVQNPDTPYVLFLTLFPMLIFCILLMLIFLGDASRLPGMRPGA